jgi:hypothetical protein
VGEPTADADSAMAVKRTNAGRGLREWHITVPTGLNWILFVGQSKPQ